MKFPCKKFPCKVSVQSLESSRYPSHRRPDSWDERVAGQDVVIGSDGARYVLFSDGGQTPPEPGWVLMLKSGDAESGYLWTLYGMTASTRS